MKLKLDIDTNEVDLAEMITDSLTQTQIINLIKELDSCNYDYLFKKTLSDYFARQVRHENIIWGADGYIPEA